MDSIYSLTMLLSIGAFTLSTVLTPGPNNIMLLSSGLTFGYKKTVPHILGIIIGFPIMVLLVGFGMGIVFENYPIILSILKLVGMIYLLWMAYKIATNVSGYELQKQNVKPFTFFQAAVFQWVNPKAWIMAITSISLFVTSIENYTVQVVIVAFVYLLSGVISTNSWTLGGVALKTILKSQKSISYFNKLMAFLLVISIIPFVIE